MNILFTSQSKHKNGICRVGQKGFSLIELMVVVAIIGILARIALPNYSDYVKKGKAAEAPSNLATLRIQMEQFFQDNRTYIGFACAPASGAKYFDYNCSVQTANTYTLNATGKTSEKMGNFSYSVDQSNNKASTYDGASVTGCWLNKKGTSC